MDAFNFVANQLVSQGRAEASEDRYQRRRTQRFMANPNNMDSLVASMTANISPSSGKPKLSSFASKTEAYDSLIPEDHPFKGLGMKIKEATTNMMLNDPRLSKADPAKIAGLVAERLAGAEGKYGISKIEEAMEYKRRADAAWFGIGGEEEDVRKPFGSAYDEWLTDRRKREGIKYRLDEARKVGPEEYARVEKELSPIATPGGIATMAGLGAAHGAYVGGLPVAALGAVAGVGMEIFGKPISKMWIEQTEWWKSLAGPLTKSRSKVGVGGVLTRMAAGGVIGGTKGIVPGIIGATAGAISAFDEGKATLASMAPYIAADLAFQKAFITTFTVPKAVAKSIVADPSAGNVIQAGKTLKAQRKIMKGDDYLSKFVNRLANPPADVQFGFNTDVYEAFRRISNDLPGRMRLSKHFVKAGKEAFGKYQADFLPNAHEAWSKQLADNKVKEAFDVISTHPEALKRAMSHPEGIIKGALEATEEVKLINYNPIAVEKEIDHSIAIEATKRKVADNTVSRVMKESVIEYEAMMGDAKEAGIRTGLTKKPYTGESVDDVYDWTAMGDEAIAGSPGAIESAPVKLTPMNTAGQAKTIDAIAEGSGKSREAVHRQISTTLNSYETPAIKGIHITGAKPTSMDIFTPQVDFTTSIREAEAIVKAGKPVAKVSKSTIPVKVEVPKPEIVENKIPLYDDDGFELIKKGEPAFDVNYQVKLPDRRLLSNRKAGTTLFKTKEQAEKEYYKFYEIASEKEAAETAGLGKEIGKIERSGKSFKKVIDTEAGPMTIEWAASKEATTKQAEKIATERAHELAATRNKEKEFDDLVKMVTDKGQKGVGKLYTDIKGAYTSGKLTAEDALANMQDLSDVLQSPGTAKKIFAHPDTVAEFGKMTQSFMSTLYKIVGTKMGLAAFGVPATAFAVFNNQDEAHAGMLNIFAEATVKGLAKAKNIPKSMEIFLSAMKKARYITPAELAKGKFILNSGDFQRGLGNTEHGGVPQIVHDLTSWFEKAPKGKFQPIRHRLMSPHMVFDEITNTGKWVMSNPGVFKASWQAAEYVNNIKANVIVDRIIEAAGIKPVGKTVSKAFEPIVPLMEDQVNFEFRTKKIAQLIKENERIVAGGKKKLAPEVKESIVSINKEKIVEHQKVLDSLKGTTERFHKGWTSIAAPLARDHSSVRTFLAVGDNAKFDKYPFLRNINFTHEEKVAVGRAKEQLAVYKKRLEALGEKVIAEDYAPHIFHPKFKAQKLIDAAGSTESAGSYLKFYKRSFNSRPLIPEFEVSLRTYVGDTERRIHQIGFWEKEGWDEVMARTAHIPSINYAFKNLKEGMTPMEKNFTNKLAQKYIEFEAVHKLFLSPSATLKHLIKGSADLAQHGPAATMEAIPLATRMTMARITKASPGIARRLASIGFSTKGAQTSLVDDYFRSMVPAYGARRYLLDLGLAPMDEMFVQARGLWGKVQDISGSGINLAELTDRGLTLVLAQQVAAKQGMTIEQGMYGIFDMLLKNNFLSREMNPRWLNTPAIRAMAMFQATPFKIFERRMVNFVRSGRVIKDLGKDIYNITKADFKAGNYNKTRLVLKDLRDLRQLVKQGEHSLKGNLFVDAALRETDYFGIPVINNFARDTLIIAAATYGAGLAGMNLKHHFFHIPFLKPGAVYPTLSFNPAVGGIARGYDAWKNREEGDTEFLTTKVYQRWLGKGWTGMLPTPAQKVLRITDNDIPAIYKKSPYKYLLAIPSVKKK